MLAAAAASPATPTMTFPHPKPSANAARRRWASSLDEAARITGEEARGGLVQCRCCLAGHHSYRRARRARPSSSAPHRFLLAAAAAHDVVGTDDDADDDGENDVEEEREDNDKDRVRRVAVVGAGFAGVAAAWHIMNLVAERHQQRRKHRTRSNHEEGKEEEEGAQEEGDARSFELHLFDEKGIAGGASGVAAGLLHPYTPRGKIIWRGVEGVAATLRLVEAAEAAEKTLEERGARKRDDDRAKSAVPDDPDVPDDLSPTPPPRGVAIAWRKGTVRPARSLKQARDLAKFAPGAAAAGGRGVCLDSEELARLLPGIDIPRDIAEECERRRRRLQDGSDATSTASGSARGESRDDAEGSDGGDDDSNDESDSNNDGDGDGDGNGETGSENGIIQKRLHNLSGRKARRAAARAAAAAPAPATAALHIPEGLVLDTGRYLSALWDATTLLAESEATPSGTSAELRIRTVTSLRKDLRGYDAIVVAAGAAVASLAELSRPDALPLQLQGGHVIELVPPTPDSGDCLPIGPTAAPGALEEAAASREGRHSTAAVAAGKGTPSAEAVAMGKQSDSAAAWVSSPPWDEHRPGILGAPYVAPLGPERLLVGTTKEFGASTADARRAGPVYFRDGYGHMVRVDGGGGGRRPGGEGGASSTEEEATVTAAREAEAELVAKSTAVYPPLAGMVVDVVRYGVRANPPRTSSGSLPLVGRIARDDEEREGGGGGGGADWWYVGGLGARGLVYHGLLGDIVARAVLTRDDGAVPLELRFDPVAFLDDADADVDA